MDREQPERDELDAAIDEALAPYEGVLPGSAIEEMRAVLRETLPEHPATQRLIRQLRGER